MFTDLMPLNSLMDDVFSDFDTIIRSSKFSFDDAFPPVNCYMNRDDKGFYLELALTGYKKDWLSVEIKGTVLTIKAEVPDLKEEENKEFFKRRIKATSFSKKYKIPTGYNVDKAKVLYEDGLLSVSIPVQEKEEPEVKKITIE